MRLGNAKDTSDSQWAWDAMYIPLESEAMTSVTCFRIKANKRIEVRESLRPVS